MNATAKIWTHDALTGRGFKDDQDRLPDVFLKLDARHQSRTRVKLDGHRPPSPEKILSFAREIIHIHPIITFDAPIAIELGAPASTTMSPWRAAGRPPIITVMLPTDTTPP